MSRSGGQPLFVVIVGPVRLILSRRDDRAFVGIDADAKHFGAANDFYVIGPPCFGLLVFGAGCLAVGLLLGCGDGDFSEAKRDDLSIGCTQKFA